jgi:hypothetical protein
MEKIARLGTMDEKKIKTPVSKVSLKLREINKKKDK